MQSGFLASDTDPCVLRDSTTGVILLVYVDDIILTGTPDSTAIATTVTMLRQRFAMKDLGELQWFLGIRIDHNADMHGIILSQERYIIDLLDRYQTTDCNPVYTPAMPSFTDTDSDTIELLDDASARTYRALVGGLLYLSTCTRPDISFVVSHLARHMQSPTTQHLQAAKRVLRYLKGTPIGLHYRQTEYGSPDTSPTLTGYADASFASDAATSRFTTGLVFIMAGAAVAWRSKLQTLVALSTTEAEYIALSHAGKEALPLRNLLAFLGHDQHRPTIIFEDNTGALLLSANPVSQQRTRHIAVRYHHIRQLVSSRMIDVVQIASADQHADLLTKVLGKPLHQTHTTFVLGFRPHN